MSTCPMKCMIMKATNVSCRNPEVLLLGPRQCGKTTLARIIAKDQGAEYFDLERPDDARRMAEPMLALEGLRGRREVAHGQPVDG